MSTYIEQELFPLTEAEQVQVKMAKMEREISNLRRGIFARHNELFNMYNEAMDLLNEARLEISNLKAVRETSEELVRYTMPIPLKSKKTLVFQ